MSCDAMRRVPTAIRIAQEPQIALRQERRDESAGSGDADFASGKFMPALSPACKGVVQPVDIVALRVVEVDVCSPAFSPGKRTACDDFA